MLCVLVHVCVQMHACNCVCYVCAYGFCTLGASSQPPPGDKGLIEGLCPLAALQSCRGPPPGIFSKNSFLVVTVLLLGSDSLGPAGSPKNISWGCVSREGGSVMGAVAGQPGHPPWESLLTSPGPERTSVRAPCQHVSAGKGGRQHGRTGRAPCRPLSKQTPLGVLCCLQAAPRVQAALGLEDVDARLAHGRRRGGRTSDRCHVLPFQSPGQGSMGWSVGLSLSLVVE